MASVEVTPSAFGLEDAFQRNVADVGCFGVAPAQVGSHPASGMPVAIHRLAVRVAAREISPHPPVCFVDLYAAGVYQAAK